MNGKVNFFPDLLITLPIVLLLFLGILVIYSSSPGLAIQQAIVALVGLAIFWGLSLIDFNSIKPYFLYFYIFTLILLAVVFILGMETRGSVRWISLGIFQLQPSEFAKPALILFLAKFWSLNQTTWKNIFKSLAIIFLAVGLIFKQPDLGTALTVMTIWLVMLVGTNISVVKLLTMGVLSITSMPFAWVLLKDYQKERILSFLTPGHDPLGTGYNVIQSMIAVGSGQFFGRGLGRGTQSRLQFLPEFRTDFIFASITEELGFIAFFLVLFLYGVLLYKAFKIISYSDRFGGLLVFGVLGMLFFQIVVNIGMNIGIIPVTGITLPLLSYGGSSLLSTLISLSFVASVARFSKKNYMVPDLD